MKPCSTWVRLGSAVAIVLGLGACDYFRPTQPEAPSSAASFIPDYGDPDSTLATIAKAIADKGITIGGTAYLQAFAESVTAGSIAGYHQFFWPQDVAEWETGGNQTPDDWNFTLEQSFYPKFVRVRPDLYHMEWAEDPPHPDNRGGESAFIHRHYQVTAHATDGTLTQYLAVGFADLTMIRFSDGNWRIVKWEDRRDPDADPGDDDQITLGMRRLNTQ